MKRHVFTVSTLLIVAALLLAGCGPQATPTPVPPTAAVKATDTPVPPTPVPPTNTPVPPTPVPPKPKQLVVAQAVDVVDMDPARAFSDTYLVIGKAMYDTLTELDVKNPGNYLPGLAEKWEISADGRVYTFHLRQGVKFQSGREMTAEDVKWSLERLKNLQGQPAWLMDGVDKVEAPDKYTVQFTLAQPDASFLARTSVCYMGTLDSEVAKANGCAGGPDAATADKCKEYLDAHSLGTGPYILESWARDSEIRLVANPNHWRGKPKFDSVVFKYVADATAQAQLLQRGDADFAMNLDPDAAKQLEGASGVLLKKELSLSIIYLGFNFRPEVSPLTSNQKFRQAVLYAIDYGGINAALGGFGASPSSVIPIPLLGGDAVPPIKRDVAKAKALLAEAGLSNPTLDFHYPAITQFSVDFNVVAQKLQADLAEAGITLNLFPEEWSVFIASYRAGQVPMTISYSTPDYADPHAHISNFAMTDNVFTKRMGYSNPKVHELALAAVQTADPAERKRIYAELLQLFNADAVFYPLVEPMEVIGYRDHVIGYEYNPVNKVTLWQLDKK
ncbi:MAG: ABC transporter substrate-binding protein [Anaerolineae bacterium]